MDIGQGGDTCRWESSRTTTCCTSHWIVWQDLVFLNEQAYPAGYFAANIMNQDQATLQSLIQYGGAIGDKAEAMIRTTDRDTFAHLLPQVRSDVSALLDVLWTYPPYCFLDKSRELEVLDKFFCESMVDA